MIIQEMSESDCLNVLAGARLARLACAHANQPYVVPIYYVYGNRYLYGFTTLGKKVEWMRSNPLVCVELDIVEDQDQWISVVFFGRYEELPEAPEQEHLHAPTTWPTRPNPERLHAHKLLQQYADWWKPGCASYIHRKSEEPLKPIFYRIRIDHVSGRRAVPSRGESVEFPKTPPGRSQRWLPRVLRCFMQTICESKSQSSNGNRFGPQNAGTGDLHGETPMNAAQRLYKQYQKDLKHLQQTCPHEQPTDWMEEWWAPAHGTGREVRACTNCDKVLQSRRKCQGCAKWFPEGQLKQGDGRIIPIGTWYCEACHKEVATTPKGSP
jgi:nitroimidazol reductase NimA-like FMN-containing flavoprotein (pyridoxamine 5'-phosphate oxidase superfamily)